MKYLVVYNTCGISTNRNLPHYFKCLDTIYEQDYTDFDVCVSSCMNDETVISGLREKYPKLLINWIKTKVPVNVSFNHTAKLFGLDSEYHGIMYLDSGCNFQDTTSLSRMVEMFESGPYGMLSASVTTDPGIAVDHEFVKNTGLYAGRGLVLDNIVSVGCSLNLHAQIFHRELLEYYNGLMPDIFAGYCTESTFSFLCAALRKQWKYMPDVIANHQTYVDGQSSGFHPSRWMAQTGRQNWDHPFAIDSYVDRFKDPVGWRVGMGFEECQKVLLHDDSQFDEQEMCINDELKVFIKENIFLTKEEFDYDSVEYEVVE